MHRHIYLTIFYLSSPLEHKQFNARCLIVVYIMVSLVLACQGQSVYVFNECCSKGKLITEYVNASGELTLEDKSQKF